MVKGVPRAVFLAQLSRSGKNNRGRTTATPEKARKMRAVQLARNGALFGRKGPKPVLPPEVVAAHKPDMFWDKEQYRQAILD
jgi:hypothetical protein